MMTISREAKMALLAIGAYWDIREADRFLETERDESNQAPLPEGWEVIKEKSGSGDNVQWFGSGFSARAYRKQSVSGKQDKIVISFAGTEFGNSYLGFAQDMFGTNIPLAIGLDAAQAYAAARFYEEVRAENPHAKITFTGHSLGGGLASLMAVWFDKPAYVFAPAPFEFAAGGLTGQALSAAAKIAAKAFLSSFTKIPIPIGARDFQSAENNVKQILKQEYKWCAKLLYPRCCFTTDLQNSTQEQLLWF